MDKLGFIFKISIIKSIYYSLKFSGIILIGYKTKVQCKKDSKIIIKKNGRLTIGVKTNLPQGTVIEIGHNVTFIVNGKVSIYKGSKVVIGDNANLTIGDNTFLNEHSKLVCQKKIDIGSNCAIAWNINIMDTDYHSIIIDGNKKEKNGSITIKDNVWIGCNSIILKNIIIGENSVVGAGTVVTKDIPINSLCVGNPGKIIKSNVEWES